MLEARERVGGRVLNEPIGDGNVVEVGGQWIGPTQDRIAALARELGVETFPTHVAGQSIFEWRGQLRRYRGKIPRIDPFVLVDIQQACAGSTGRPRRPAGGALDGTGRAGSTGRPPPPGSGATCHTRGGRDLMQLGVEAVWAAEPEDVSLLHLLFYVHSAGPLELLTETEGGAQQDRFVGGSQLVADQARGGARRRAVLLWRPVRTIRTARRASWSSRRRPSARGRRAIVAIAPALAGRIAYDPPLPGHRDQLTQRMPLGTVAKCMAIYDEPFWRADGLSGLASATAARSS